MFMGFENAKKRTGFAARIFAYTLASYWLIIKRQNKQIHSLKKELKEDRKKIATFIENGILHSETECGSLCEPHIIVKFIRDLKD
jgi:hypothetical protein